MKKLVFLSFGFCLSLFSFNETISNVAYAAGAPSSNNIQVVNVYSARKEYLIKPLIKAFEKETNIKVNLVAGKAKSLQKRLELEGKNTQADVLLTVDAGNLYRATWNSNTQSKISISSGIYFYRMISRDFEKEVKMTIIK